MPRLTWLALLLSSLVACGGKDEEDTSTSEADICGDIDGDGTDTGDVPNILGNWTADFGWNSFQTDCGIEGFSNGGDVFLDGAMEVRGRVPNSLYVVFDSVGDEDRFFGLVSNGGGVSFSGVHEDHVGTMHVAFGGLVYFSPQRNRTFIDGFGFVGLDTDGDGVIDCSGRGEWQASKSGA
ncbi:MAG: hypothetical protein H6741_23815 [Alphaproteobacteria bacterium]|nr:hypothetical protein [Alphaproteobacteria bacterium]